MQAPTETQTSTYLSARWVLPVDSEPIENGVVEFGEGKIRSVHSRTEFLKHRPAAELVDYGLAVIMPGLINLHTHIDYTGLGRFDTQSGLFRWIQGLVKEAFQWTPEQWQQSADMGAGQIALSGTTCVADCSFTGTATARALSRLGLRGVIGLELFGSKSADADKAFKLWSDRLESLKAAHDEDLARAIRQGTIQFTVSPHAPYTVSPVLWKKAVDWARNHQMPVLCHVSESLPECRWIAGHDDEVEAFLSAVDPNYASGKAQPYTWKGQGLTPVQHLEHHGLLTGSTIAAHAVHLDDRDIELLSARQVKVAHCPRSNARLRNGIAPINRLIEKGVAVGFGTDSLASTDSLDVLSEARFAWNLQRAVDPSFSRSAREAIHALTLGAARMLNLDSKIGSLQPGKDADLAVFSLDSNTLAGAGCPYESLLHGEPRIQDVFVHGRPIVKAGTIA